MGAQKVNIPKLGIFLGVVASLAAGLLAFANSATLPKIQENKTKKGEEALRQVLPDFKTTSKQVFGNVEFTIALDDSGKVVGFAGITAQEGFSGQVKVVVGMNPDGSIRKVLVTEQTETPGLGTVITDRKVQKTITDLFSGAKEVSGLPPNQYLDQYEGLWNAETQWAVKKDGGDFDAKTGATITSRAVCGAVHSVHEAAVSHLKELVKGAE